ncbi:DUF3021 domain-containing protein [Pueribacillus sp. YX66]|uniref:DUF3021 domain-containing protein n=1 Tax=Pueribacillus sp. YX66 TaxID=3229242 RepID=UPI00358CEE7B
MKTFLFRSVIGILLGAFLSVLTMCSIVWIGDQSTLDGHLFVKNALGSMFAGWFFSAASLYFEIESLKLFMQTILHFVTVTILYFILAFGIGWVPIDPKSVMTAIIIFIVIYTIMWLSFYFYFRNESRKLNEDLQNLSKK